MGVKPGGARWCFQVYPLCWVQNQRPELWVPVSAGFSPLFLGILSWCFPEWVSSVPFP